MAPSATQILIVLLIVILLFGAKKIPELAKGMGSGIKNFKKAMREDEEEEVMAKNVENKVQDGIKTTSKFEEKQS
ncbi:twin-arginine translocase TatA/TatE family subunit [Helicobacter pametensis]|uniref:twin-arginine translocase TatA/TatE family subunit n=1 Tax=Helicobacter pametensis TaxID=95149 RepID=UPI00048514BA|nr:twin-arginine translocase TatA/TatE family subunit [Helicobacter pametensis]